LVFHYKNKEGEGNKYNRKVKFYKRILSSYCSIGGNQADRVSHEQNNKKIF